LEPAAAGAAGRLGFLGLCPFRCENRRISVLDSLGFSRPNRVFSMGYTDFSLKKFSRAFLARQGVERAIAF
jgi:hypothetical protein